MATVTFAFAGDHGPFPFTFTSFSFSFPFDVEPDTLSLRLNAAAFAPVPLISVAIASGSNIASLIHVILASIASCCCFFAYGFHDQTEGLEDFAFHPAACLPFVFTTDFDLAFGLDFQIQVPLLQLQDEAGAVSH